MFELDPKTLTPYHFRHLNELLINFDKLTFLQSLAASSSLSVSQFDEKCVVCQTPLTLFWAIFLHFAAIAGFSIISA